MANHKIETVKTQIPIPPQTREEHAASTQPRVVWYDEQINRKSSLTCNYGDTWYTGNVDNAHGNGKIGRTIWQSNGNYGWEATQQNGNSHDSLFEFHGKTNRYQRASIFNGIAFQMHQDSSYNTSMYVSLIALTWKKLSADRSYRHWGTDYNGSNSEGYKYFAFNHEYDIRTINNWGSDWGFYGITLYVRNGSGMAKTSTVKMWDVRLHHKGSTLSSNHMMVLPKMRGDAQRNEIVY